MMSKSKHSIRIPDYDYWCKQVKCQAACPVRTDARGYVRAIAEGNDELAYLIARGPNPIASICGRVCGAPCEKACRRGDLDEPIAIRALKRYVCDRFGPESRPDGGKNLIEYLKHLAKKYGPWECQGYDELLPLLQSLTDGKIIPVKNKSIGIIGSGPAGLSAAHDLALLGFSVVIYEMEPMLGGMLAVGVPEYRLPRSIIEAETDVITALGVQSITNCCIGKDISFPELRQKHDAVIIAVGLKASRKLPIPGADAKGVLGGVEFLRDVCIGNPPALGETIVVIGGGSVAYDVSRTVLRQTSLDTARTALREAGVKQVYLCSLESLEEMPAEDIEIIEGDEEGVVRRNSLGPQEILTDSEGHVRGVRFQRCLRIFDEQKRFNPQFDEHDITEIACDNVLLSIGQAVDLTFLDSERDGITMTERGMIACDPKTGATSASDVFISGDLVYGPKLLIHGVESGKAVARALYEKFSGNKITAKQIELHLPIANFQREKAYEKHPRTDPTKTPVRERLKGQLEEVEKGYTEEEARREAGRCFDCGVNTIFDGDLCILCGGCVDVCPSKCFSIVPLDELEDNDRLQQIITTQLDGYPPDQASAFIMDETICIRCGLCAERCPTEAITMEQFHFRENLQCRND